jgi:hypothetical protein
MKYFTLAWHNGELSDAESDSIRQAYRRHIEKLAPQLPSAIAELATQVELHDALIRKVVFDLRRRTLRLELLCGDKQVGYFDLEMHYADVSLGRNALSALQAAAQDAETEVLYDEVDRVEDGYVHRLLCWPHREIDIQFRQLALHRTPRLDRERRAQPGRYEEVL